MGMTNYVENELWAEITVTVATCDIDSAAAIVNMVVPYGIYIEDYSALEEETMEIAHIDLIDRGLLNKDREHGIIHVYVNPDENPAESAAYIENRLMDTGITYDLRISDCKTEDWQNKWKQYFHPTPIGKKLLIRPIWIDDYDAGNRKVLDIEPGLAFGTGAHPTTRLCLEKLEEYLNPHDKVLDIGCGSGILSIAALLLGADSAMGVDIDELAVKTAISNAEMNGFTHPQFCAVTGNLSDKVDGKFDMVVANIVADVVMQFNTEVGEYMNDGGIYITGGIIENREPEVLASFAANGFEVVDRSEDNGWLVFVLRKVEQ